VLPIFFISAACGVELSGELANGFELGRISPAANPFPSRMAESSAWPQARRPSQRAASPLMRKEGAGVEEWPGTGGETPAYVGDEQEVGWCASMPSSCGRWSWPCWPPLKGRRCKRPGRDRKCTRLNSSHDK